MIVRIWRGWTRPEAADEYQNLLRSEIGPGIAGRHIAGLRGPRVLRRDTGDGEVEFVTLMSFPDWGAVQNSPGPTGTPRWCPRRPGGC